MKERNTVDFGVPLKRSIKKRKKPLTINFSYFIILAQNREPVKSKNGARGIFSARKGGYNRLFIDFFYKLQYNEIMIIVGFDPGLATLGYGVIRKDDKRKPEMVDYGVVLTPKDKNLPDRLIMIEKGVKQIIDKFRPDEIAIEELFFAKNVKTGIAVAHSRGVTLLTATKECGRIFEYTPLQIKQALTGYGRADKNQIQQMVKTFLGLKAVPKPDDAADALAVALCHAQTNKLGGLFRV